MANSTIVQSEGVDDDQQAVQAYVLPTAVSVQNYSPNCTSIPTADVHLVATPPSIQSTTDTCQNQRTNNATILEATALPLEDSFRKNRRRKLRRVAHTQGGAVGGAVFGLIFLGPLGLSIGLASGAAVAYGATKLGERRKDKRFARRTAVARRTTITT